MLKHDLACAVRYMNLVNAAQDENGLPEVTAFQQKFRDPSFLPMLQEVRHAYKLAQPSTLETDEMRLAERAALAQALQKSGAKLPTMPAKLLPEDNAFLLYTLGQAAGLPEPMYEILTCEYVAALASYIHERCVLYHQQQQEAAFSSGSINPNDAEEQTQQPLQILEIGAGDGRLAHFLDCKLRILSLRAGLPPPKLVATDNLEFGLTTHFPVQRIGHVEALRMVPGPTLVIVSWMPSGVDFTESIRDCASVQEYILIGEADGSVCGDASKSWGVSDTPSAEQSVNVGGFERIDVGLTPLQICRSDSSAACGFSRTVSFRRRGEKTEGAVTTEGAVAGTRIVVEVVPEDVLTTTEQAADFYAALKQNSVAGVKEWVQCTHTLSFGMLSLHVTCSLDVGALPQHQGRAESASLVCRAMEMLEQVQCATILDSFETERIETQHQTIREAEQSLREQAEARAEAETGL
jgi:hypothetical protein